MKGLQAANLFLIGFIGGDPFIIPYSIELWISGT